jgi:trehalose 6-phosphate phosphatase
MRRGFSAANPKKALSRAGLAPSLRVMLLGGNDSSAVAQADFVSEQRKRYMSRLLAQVISEVKERIQAANSVSLFLDFDGTLVPIADHPMDPQLDPETAETLKLIASQGFLTTTIISGRAVQDLYSRVRVEGLIYAGNHGLEIFGRDLRFVEPLASSRRQELQMLCRELAAKVRRVAGAIVENKGLTASVHYRMVATADVPEIQAAVYEAVARNSALFRVNLGRKVFEILPRTNWHKGAAVRWINSQLGEKPAFSIYLGDDTTDEDAFGVLPDAITIKVGPAPVTSVARYQLPDPAAVHEFLLWLAMQESLRLRKV